MSENLTVRPYGNKVLVVEIDKEVSSKAQLIVLNAGMGEDNRFVKGLVKAVGDPIPNIAGVFIDPKIKVDDVVVFNKHNAVGIEHENKKYKLVPYHEIQAVLTEDTSKYLTSGEDLIPRNTRFAH